MRSLSLSLLCLLGSLGLLWAFVPRGPVTELKGTVVDAAGSPVAAAHVAVVNASNHAQATASSDASGSFSVRYTPATGLRLHIHKAGFEDGYWSLDTLTTTQFILYPQGSNKDAKAPSGLANMRPNQESMTPGPLFFVGGKGGALDKNKVANRTHNPSPLGMKPPPQPHPTQSGKDTTDRPGNTEDYSPINENPFQAVTLHPLSTFSIDVDAASYANVRRFITQGELPPQDAVRLEEMVNYFTYDYPQPVGDVPLGITTEVNTCPWNTAHQLLLVGMQGKRVPTANLPPANLVFLLDVSGSMSDENKLPLLKSAFKLLVNQLRPQDRVAIVVYAGAAGLILPSTPGNERQKMLDALDNLQAGGSTAGGQGIELAYKTAESYLMKEGNNRVILATDGDFNVGPNSDGELQRLIEHKRQTGIYLSVLGFGMGNYKDNKMEILADKGNGNYAYIDNLQEARKVLVSQFGGTLFTIANDVKLQLEFNPKLVQGYRLLGYEDRLLADEDFRDDKKDAGEVGSGHSVTALYELIPVGVPAPELREVKELKYQQPTNPKSTASELATVALRYKLPGQSTAAKELSFPVQAAAGNTPSLNWRFATSVAEFGLLLRKSEYKGNALYDRAAERAGGAVGPDVEGYRAEFVRLVKMASQIKQ